MQQRIGEAVGEVFIGLVLRKTFKGQHRNRTANRGGLDQLFRCTVHHTCCRVGLRSGATEAGLPYEVGKGYHEQPDNRYIYELSGTAFSIGKVFVPLKAVRCQLKHPGQHDDYREAYGHDRHHDGADVLRQGQ